MSDLQVRREKTCDCPDKSDCECGWDMGFCCHDMEVNFMSADGAGGPFSVESDMRTGRAIGIELDLSGGGGSLAHINFCPFCGASSGVVDELPVEEVQYA